MSRKGIYSTGNHTYRKLRAKLKAKAQRENIPCHLCGKPIDFSAPPNSSWSFEADHLIPVSKGGKPLSMDGLAPSHSYCNRSKNNRTPKPKLKIVGDWLK